MDFLYKWHKLGAEQSSSIRGMNAPAKSGQKRFRPWYEIARLELRAKGLTYAKLAEQMNVSTAAVGHWMIGRREPTLAQIKYIADLVGKSLSELCGEDPYFLVDPSERKLIDTFRHLTPAERELFLRFLPASKDKPQK